MRRTVRVSVAAAVLGASACTAELGGIGKLFGNDDVDVNAPGSPSTGNDPSASGGNDPGSSNGGAGSNSGPGTSDRSGFDDPASDVDSEPVPVRAYTAKVKSLVVGEALSADELARVEEDPAALRNLVSTWLEDPRAKAKLQAFFTTAFQQEGFPEDALARHFGLEDLFFGWIGDSDIKVSDVLMRSFGESFGRTALHAFDNDWSFADLAGTDEFMMTTAMMVSLALNDEAIVDDTGEVSHRTLDGVEVVYQRHEEYPLSRVLDPDDEVFLHFYSDDDSVVPDACPADEVRSVDPRVGSIVYNRIMGTFLDLPGLNRTCRKRQRTRVATLLDDSDFEDWRMVKIRRPRSGERADRFFEFDALRGADELVLHTPRVGFFTTPAFLALWETNPDNQARGTLNQTLITAYGQSIEGDQTILPAFDDALDGEHADPGTVCYSCHKTLDPMRQFFRRDYTYSFHQQQSRAVRDDQAAFAWDGVESGGESIEEFAELLVGHPNLARGWTQKLCWYANSAPCPAGDELDRVVSDFAGSGMNFRELMVELFTSRLVTGADIIAGANGDLPSVARARHFCGALSARIDEPDICGLYTDIENEFEAAGTRLRRVNNQMVGVIPDDAFARGGSNPITISDVSLFTRNAYEQICSNIAKERVDQGDALFDVDDVDTTLENLASRIAAIPENDPRYPDLLEILREHYTEAARQTTNSATAMQSTFVVACMAPSSIGMGF